MTRQEAIKAGAKFYDGKPCPHGHTGTRNVIDRYCIECRSAYDAARYRQSKGDGFREAHP